ncbi:SurA N-terminal domain-containing protein [Thermithiobacillus plumbiphilus]|uniref:Periplasmic chaperone PpiD n=1 Tax=Thermithiobacillus plumbiphilus TaxID=1729899 RepID=A0ABU9D980_9PROT
MLEAFRNIGQSWVAKLLLALIALSFALWGVSGYFSDDPGGQNVAEVNGAAITQKAFQERYKQEVERYRQMLGKDFSPQMLESMKLKDQVLEAMINYQVLVNETRRLGLHVPDAEVVKFIQTLPVFSDEKGFSRQRYQQLLAQQGMTPASFESQVREELAVRQLEQGISTAPLTAPNEVASLFAISEETRKVEVAIIPAQAFADKVTVSPEAVAAYYKAHQAEFRQPERVKVSYVVMGPEAFEGKAQVSEDELKAAYDKQKDNFKTAEERSARHILISIPQDATPEQVKAAQDRAESLVKRLRDGADFAQLARQESGDPGSAAQGGDLGFFGRGAMVKPFEDAVFSLKPGQISDPVRTPFGFHIIQVQEVRPERVQEFAEVRPQLERELRREKAEKAFDEATANFKDLLFTQDKSLDAAAKEFGLPVQQSEWLTRNAQAPGIFADPKVINQVFSNRVLGGKNSEAVELSDGRVAGFHLQAREPAKQLPLAAVEDQITEKLRLEKAEAAAKAAANDLLKSAQNGQPLSQLAAQNGYQVETATLSRRNAEQLPEPLVRAAFQAPEPAVGKVSYGMTSMPGGAFVYGVDEVKKPSASELQGPLRQQIADFLQNQRGGQAFKSYLDTLRAQAEVKVYKDKL